MSEVIFNCKVFVEFVRIWCWFSGGQAWVLAPSQALNSAFSALEGSLNIGLLGNTHIFQRDSISENIQSLMKMVRKLIKLCYL